MASKESDATVRAKLVDLAAVFNVAGRFVATAPLKTFSSAWA
jgi:hypothetical protein